MKQRNNERNEKNEKINLLLTAASTCLSRIFKLKAMIMPGSDYNSVNNFNNSNNLNFNFDDTCVIEISPLEKMKISKKDNRKDNGNRNNTLGIIVIKYNDKCILLKQNRSHENEMCSKYYLNN